MLGQGRGMKLAAVSLIVPDYDAAIAFYCGQMGFDVIADIDQGRKRWVEVCPWQGGASFVLARADSWGWDIRDGIYAAAKEYGAEIETIYLSRIQFEIMSPEI